MMGGSLVVLAFVGLGAYALGSVSTAYYLVRLRTGTDVRAAGSGTAGATNAGRLLGTWAYVMVALLDVAKGALAVGLASLFVVGPAAPTAPVVALVGSVAGHIWPPQLGFRGGKGVATIFGGVLALSPTVALLALAVFGVLYIPTRRYHLSGQIGIAAAPVIGWWRELDGIPLVGLTIAVGIVLLVHFTRRTAGG